MSDRLESGLIAGQSGRGVFRLFRYLRSLKLSQQILFLVSTFTIPISCAALYFIVTGINKDIDFAIHEQHGNAYQRRLETLLENLPEHERLTVAWHSGDRDAGRRMLALEVTIEQAWDQLEKVQSQYGSELQFTWDGLSKRKRDHIALFTVRKEWGQLKADSLSSAPGNLEIISQSHRHLVADIRTMITHAGDTSFLILDPDLDSYYLMDATLQALPQTQDRLAQIAGYSEDLLKTLKADHRYWLDMDERIQFAVFHSQLQEADEDRISGDAQTALNEDAGFYGISESLQRNLPPALKIYQNENQALLKVLERLSKAGDAKDLPESFRTAASVRASSFRLWGTGVDELDRLLSVRIQHYVDMRTRGLIATGAALLLSALLAMLVISDITRSLKRIMATLHIRAVPLAGGITPENTAKHGTSDELAILSNAFDEMLAGIELRDAELALNRKNLEMQVVQRTAELTHANERLQAAMRRAEETARMKGEFLANMSHEIRTPMNGVLGMTELALTTDLTREQRDYLSTAKSSASDLLVIINDILDFSKIEAGKLTLLCAPFELRKTFSDAVRGFAFRAHEKNLELLWYVTPSVPDWIACDPVRLNQIVVNLLGNAVKFTDKGEVVLYVDTVADPDLLAVGRLRLQVSVADSGIGIPGDKQSCIFEAFQQADGSATRQYGGTGLGLAIVSQLVKLMSGRVWVESEPGKGSTFCFTCEVNCVPGRRNDVSNYQGRVLVVDDHSKSRLFLSQQLKDWGADVISVESGEAALSQVQRAEVEGQPFQRILLDSHMPGLNGPGPDLPNLDGFACAAKLAEAGYGQSVVMMLGGGEQRQNVLKAKTAQIREYLLKPVNPRELREALFGPQSLPVVEQPEKSLISTTKQLSILVVEDNAVNRKLLEKMLYKRGHSVALASDGFEALDILKSTNFDVVLMDVQMPGLTGFDVTASIREDELGSARHLPIIAVTANAMEGDRDRCLKAGMDGFVSKPIRFHELDEMLNTIANAHPAVLAV